MAHLVAVVAHGGRAFVDALLHAWDQGQAVLPLDPRLPRPATAAVLEAMSPAAVVDADGAAAHRPGGRPVEDGDALVVATSGTTGVPKGVVLTHDAVRVAALASSARLGVDAGADRWLACLPLAHVGGLSVVTRALATGTPLTVLAGFDAGAVEAAAAADAKRRATLVSLVPTALDRVDASAFRRVLVGGSADGRERANNVVRTYGLTETGGGVVYDGVPLDNVEVRAVDGELQVRGPTLLRCYRDDTDPKDDDGWLATGDAGEVDGPGDVHVLGRLDDTIVTGGEKVWPQPVEAVLASSPGVADVAVAGGPDPEWGQRVVAYVVPADRASPPTLDGLRALAKARLPAYAAPRELVLVDRLPRTATGKLVRGRLARTLGA